MKKIIFILVILLIPMISSAWPIGKYQTCDMLNLTKQDCEMVWCQIIDCVYDSNRTACICNSGLSQSNINLNTTEFYNKTEIEKLLFNLTNMTIVQITELDKSIDNLSNNTYYTRQQVDDIVHNRTIELRDSLLENEEERTKDYVRKYSTSTNTNTNSYFDMSPWIIIVALFGLFAFIGVMTYLKIQEKEKKKTKVVQFNRGFTNPNQFYSKEQLEDIKKETSKPLKPFKQEPEYTEEEEQ